MEQRIRERYNDNILAEALKRYAIPQNTIRLLDGFESFIYECKKDGKEYILRISHSFRRTSDMIQGEIDWVNYLADHGVSVPRVFPSAQGHLVEVIPDGFGAYFATACFEKVHGRHVKKEDYSPALYQKMGRMMGKMHALAKDYAPPNPLWQRPVWSDELEGFAAKHLPASETTVIHKHNELIQHFHALPKDQDSYGLIHIDFHGGNFFLNDGEITLFDFDDCQYFWFAADIAIALFYMLPHHCTEQKHRDFAKAFFMNFMEGYALENTLDPVWLRQIPSFLKQREIDLYICIHRSMDLDDLDPWCQSFMTGRKQKIENDVPYIEMDFGLIGHI